MEGLESSLPEGAFAEFRALRDKASTAPAPKRLPLVWVIVPAVAAGLAAVLFLRGPENQEDGVQLIHQPAPPVAVVKDSTVVIEPMASTPLLAQVVKPITVKPKNVKPKETGPVETKPEVTIPEPDRQPTAEPQEVVEVEDVVVDDQPVVEKARKKEAVDMRIAPITGIVAGGGLVAALASSLLRVGASDNVVSFDDLPNYLDYPNQATADLDCLSTGKPRHSLPLRLGLSMRIPLAQNLNVTTGVDYSRYSSIFTYSLSGENTQVAQYLGIPVRLDWSFVSKKWFEAYLGAGFEGDMCVSATLAGNKIKKDGLSLSMIGAGGMQFNVTKWAGLYVEPQMTWSMPSKARVLETYRSEHPLMFSATGGIRFTFGR